MTFCLKCRQIGETQWFRNGLKKKCFHYPWWGLQARPGGLALQKGRSADTPPGHVPPPPHFSCSLGLWKDKLFPLEPCQGCALTLQSILILLRTTPSTCSLPSPGILPGQPCPGYTPFLPSQKSWGLPRALRAQSPGRAPAVPMQSQGLRLRAWPSLFSPRLLFYTLALCSRACCWEQKVWEPRVPGSYLPLGLLTHLPKPWVPAVQ